MQELSVYKPVSFNAYLMSLLIVKHSHRQCWYLYVGQTCARKAWGASVAAFRESKVSSVSEREQCAQRLLRSFLKGTIRKMLEDKGEKGRFETRNGNTRHSLICSQQQLPVFCRG